MSKKTFGGSNKNWSINKTLKRQEQEGRKEGRQEDMKAGRKGKAGRQAGWVSKRGNEETKKRGNE